MQSARILDAASTNIAFTDADGREWSGISCHMQGNSFVIDGDGYIPNLVKAFIAGGGTVTPYTAPPGDLVAYAANKRWQKEVGGVVINGMPVPTDDRAKLLILGAAQTLADEATAPFVVNGVNYGTFTGVQFQAVNSAVVAHVQATFMTLATVLAGIAGNSVTTTAQIDAAFAA